MYKRNSRPRSTESLGEYVERTIVRGDVWRREAAIIAYASIKVFMNGVEMREAVWV